MLAVGTRFDDFRVILPALILGGIFGSTAWAQTAPPLTRSDFSIDTYRGPVIGSSRVTGMAGAFVAVAEESVGIQFNPAAAAQTPYYSNTWFDWYVDWAFLAPGIFQPSNFDFDNSGTGSADDFLAYFVAGGLQFGEFGIGAYFTGQLSKSEITSAVGEPLKADSGHGALAAAYALWQHQIILGAAFDVSYLTLKPEGDVVADWIVPAFAGDFGVIYRPRQWPFRIGVRGRTPSIDIPAEGCSAETCPNNFVVPKGIANPWELRFGGAWFFSFDNRSFNPDPFYWDDSFQAQLMREFEWDGELEGTYRGGRYLMLSADVAVLGSTKDAIGLDGLNTQTRLTAGQHTNISVHFGAESEILVRRLRLRLGTYYEPSRYTDGSGRMHITFGWLLRMFDWDVPVFGPRGICFQGALDFAERYSNVGGSILSFWH